MAVKEGRIQNKERLCLKPKLDQMKFILLEVGSGFLPLQRLGEMNAVMHTKKKFFYWMKG